MKKSNIRLLTFADFIHGLSAAALEAQYFDEYIKLSQYVDRVTIVSAEVSGLPNLPDNVKIVKAPISKIPKLRGIAKMLYYTILSMRSRKKINLIYVRTMSPPEIQSLWISKLFFNIPSVLMIGGTCFYEPLNYKNRFYRWLYSKALDSSDRVVVYSKLMIPYIKKLNPKIPDSKFDIVHNAVDSNRFHLVPKNMKLFSKIGLKESDKVIIFVGKINERKGVIDILKMMSLLQDQNVKTIFIGSYEKDSLEFSKIQNEVKTSNLSSQVFFLGKIPNNELIDYTSCADVMVYLTKACEGIPRAILEAMACGKPIIATPIAGIPDAVINYETGFVVENYSEAAKKVEELFSDKSLYEKISKNCRLKIEREFVYDVTLPKMLEIFQKVLQNY